MPRRILVIEDNQDLAHLLQIHLRDLSFEFDPALDGHSGLAKAESNRYDLIILDIVLPVIDGREICRRVRSKDTYSPILMLTPKSSEFDRVLGLEMGAEGHSGLGLAIAKKILELHDRSIGVTSRPGSGTTFIFHLPGVDPA